jgi:hypothetical protein
MSGYVNPAHVPAFIRHASPEGRIRHSERPEVGGHKDGKTTMISRHDSVVAVCSGEPGRPRHSYGRDTDPRQRPCSTM